MKTSIKLLLFFALFYSCDLKEESESDKIKATIIRELESKNINTTVEVSEVAYQRMKQRQYDSFFSKRLIELMELLDINLQKAESESRSNTLYAQLEALRYGGTSASAKAAISKAEASIKNQTLHIENLRKGVRLLTRLNLDSIEYKGSDTLPNLYFASYKAYLKKPGIIDSTFGDVWLNPDFNLTNKYDSILMIFVKDSLKIDIKI